ncbi:uncharacterized protein LOC142222443 [Haematobia irritans]|uniref:uncharacterized protein LOC142222443 n=1 Tax=Haematobia irritans TaxID=7368 RepID=UPI003F504F31
MIWRFAHIFLFSFLFIFSIESGLAGPTTTVVKDDPIKESLEELNDLNESAILRDSSSMLDSQRNSYNHRDEDMLDNGQMTAVFKNLKYDVEILESNENLAKKEDNEIEERYRGPAIVINTDEFINENIEMNADEERADKEALANTHLILSIILVVIALISISLYAALVMWRSHIEQRYGMRELLVTNDNQDYWPQHMTDSGFPSQHHSSSSSSQQQHSSA